MIGLPLLLGPRRIQSPARLQRLREPPDKGFVKAYAMPYVTPPLNTRQAKRYAGDSVQFRMPIYLQAWFLMRTKPKVILGELAGILRGILGRWILSRPLDSIMGDWTP